MLALCAASAGHTEPVAPRFDAPITPANSVLFDFGYGKIMRLPKLLFNPSLIPKDPRTPMHAQAIGMIFSYPDMTPSGWVSAMDNIFLKLGNKYVMHKDRFSVNVTLLYYSPDDRPGLPDGPYMIEPRPAQIVTNISCISSRDPACKTGFTAIPSKMTGIDPIVSTEYLTEHPESKIYDPEIPKGSSYIAKPKSSYDLYMSCHRPGSECLAHVFSKKHQFQYRMIFPSEAVSHTHDLIMSIEKMLDQWELR
jgi:hypothetical protein